MEDYSYFDISDFASLYAVLKYSERDVPIWYDTRGIRDISMGETLNIMEYVLTEETKKLEKNEDKNVYQERIGEMLDYITKREIVDEGEGEMNVSKDWWMNNRNTLLEKAELLFKNHLRKSYFIK